MTSRSRQNRAEDGEQPDYLSQLPDTLLGHILSFMSTRSAFRTSILSKRWEKLWTMVPVWDFSDVPSYVRNRYPNSEEQKYLKNFLDKVLVSNNIPIIERFHWVAYGRLDILYVRLLNNAITRREIREIHLTQHRCSWSKPMMGLFLPSSVFSCEKLVVLKIEGPFLIDVETSLNLPSIEVIYLTDIKFVGTDVMKFLSLGCPVLREFTIEGCRGLSKLVIHSLTLKKLEMRWMMCESHNEDKYIVVEAPSISYLVFEGNMGQYKISDLSTLVKAKFEIYDEGEQLHLVRKIPNVENLMLGQSIVEGIGDLSENELPMFLKLTHLEMVLGHDILQVLKCAPNLVHLTVNVGRVLDKRRTLSLETVPSCLVSLSTIEIQRFAGNEIDTELVGYLLKNAKVLKEMKIHMHKVSVKRQRDVLKKLLPLQRASAECQVIICSSCGNS